MSLLERRLLYLGLTLLFLAFVLGPAQGQHIAPVVGQNRSSTGGFVLSSNPVDGSDQPDQAQYYGADLSAGGGMEKATGVNATNHFDQPDSAPWPQYTGNYCFLAVLQALINYEYWKTNHALVEYPRQSDQGPPSPDPSTPWGSGTSTDEQSPQILWAMDTQLQPPGGALPAIGSGRWRRPFTLANSSYDFGGDPRAMAVTAAYLAPSGHSYHQYIYHDGVVDATYRLAQSVTVTYPDGGASPAMALVNSGAHIVVVAGVWSYGSTLTSAQAQIDSFAVYNPWNEQWGGYINGAYYARVSYASWMYDQSILNGPFDSGHTSWWARPYDSNGGLDPDPATGPYQPGRGSHHWIGNYVTVQRDLFFDQNADTCYDEHNRAMSTP